jgi:hypothetical protein
MSQDTKKTVTVTLTHYARRKNRIVTFKARADRDEFFCLPQAEQERIRDLHHAFVFVASCAETFHGLYAVCYGRRGWSLTVITRLYEAWAKGEGDWRILAGHVQG